MTPLMDFLADDWLLVAERVAEVTGERHLRPDSEAVAPPTAVYRDARVEARVRLHHHT